MTIRRIALVLVAAAALQLSLQGPAFAHDDGETKLAPGVQAQIADVRRATARFHDFKFATDRDGGGYTGLVTDLAGKTCIDQPGQGGMGIHYINGQRVGDPKISALEPEILVYEPDKHGRLQLEALEYLVMRESWDAANPQPPMLFGHPFHLVRSPNRYGLPDFYELHLWAWKKNKNGVFNDWNPAVQCHSGSKAAAH